MSPLSFSSYHSPSPVLSVTATPLSSSTLPAPSAPEASLVLTYAEKLMIQLQELQSEAERPL
uniref:Uncharacterized protein n=1 Tax=Medicago truncatula TaxID=3880 RepID=A2Q3W8_MEDTR|nr:hypothetical protein MtrDRAFT_AC155890g34v2 [Medicago truncatula]